MFCPKCHRKLSNMPRDIYDPPRATLMHVWCYRCSSGGKDAPVTFFTATGIEIGFEEVEAAIRRATPQAEIANG